MKKWRKTHSDQEKATKSARYQKFRLDVLATYGGKCACCGETQPKFLSIDHINGGGKKDRIARGFREGGMNWYKFLLETHPGHVQLLCYNCNMAKSHYGQCPHQERKQI